MGEEHDPANPLPGQKWYTLEGILYNAVVIVNYPKFFYFTGFYWLFMSVTYKCSYDARVFVLDKPFVTSLVFVGEAYLSEAPCEAPFGYSILG